MYKWIITGIFCWLSLVACAGALPDNADFSQWNNGCPTGWTPIEREDRPCASLQRESDGIALDGMIKSEKYRGFAGKKVSINIRARGDKGKLKVYLFEYNAGDANLYRVAQVIDADTADAFQEFSGVVEMAPWASADELELVIDGRNVVISGVTMAEHTNTPQEQSNPGLLTLPLVRQAPVPDGNFSPEEWRESILLKSGFRNIATGTTVKNQSAVYLCADRNNLYLAVLYPIYPGGVRANVSEHDDEVHTDEAVELIFNPDFSQNSPANLYQIVANFIATTLDVRHSLATGQQMIGWNCTGLEVKAGGYDGNYLLEMKIPFASVGIEDPARPWGLNLCRDLISSSENSTLTGGGYFKSATMVQCQVLPNAPAISLGVDEFNSDGHYVFNLSVDGKDRYLVSFKELGGEQFQRNLTLDSGRQELKIDLKQRKIQFAEFETVVKSVDGREWFRFVTNLRTRHYGQQMTAIAGSSHKLAIEYYPFQQKLNARLTNLKAEDRQMLQTAEFEVTNPGGEKSRFHVPLTLFNQKEAHFSLPFAPEENGLFQVTVAIQDRDGNTITSHERMVEKQDFPWLGNQLGKTSEVIPPFTPLRKSNHMVSCLMRDYDFGPDGLPTQIIADRREVLNKAVTLQLTVRDQVFYPTEATLDFSLVRPDRMEFKSDFQLDGVQVELTGWMEYDGVVFYTLRFAAKKAVEIQKLSLLIPIQNAQLFHYVSDYIRLDNNYRNLNQYKDDGTVWDSMQAGFSQLSGNFLPSVWLGNYDRGIQFFAESDENWINDTSSPVVELQKQGDNFTLAVNLFAKTFTLTTPRTVQFGLIANPVRNKAAGANMRYSRKWQTSFASGYFNVGLLPIDDYISQTLIPDDTPSYLPYTCGNLYVSGDPEFKLIKDEFSTIPVAYDPSEVGLSNYGVAGVDNDNYLSQYISWTPERVDFMLWRINDLMAKFKVDGVYLDNTYPYFNFNVMIKNGGYFREDGKYQPKCNFLLTREYLKRVATLAHQYGKRFPRIVIHNTDAQLLGAFAFADVTFGGEMDIPEDKTHFDVFPPERTDTMWGVNWGIPGGALTMLGYGARSTEEVPNRAMWAIFKLYDMAIWPSGLDLNLFQTLQNLEEKFGTASDDCTFTGYWENDWLNFLDNPDEYLKASYFERPGKKLIYLANHGNEAREAVFTLKDPGTLRNGESRRIIKMEDGVYRIKVNAKDFKVMEFTQQAKEEKP